MKPPAKKRFVQSTLKFAASNAAADADKEQPPAGDADGGAAGPASSIPSDTVLPPAAAEPANADGSVNANKLKVPAAATRTAHIKPLGKRRC